MDPFLVNGRTGIPYTSAPFTCLLEDYKRNYQNYPFVIVWVVWELKNFSLKYIFSYKFHIRSHNLNRFLQSNHVGPPCLGTPHTYY